MLRSYLKTAFRNLHRTRTYSSINILGLAVGLAACLLVLHYVRFERSYDRFQPGFERIYRLRYERTSEEGTSVRFASCCPPAAGFIRGNYPEVEEIARITRYRAVVGVGSGEVSFTEDRMYYAEPEFFRIFDIPFLSGDPQEGIREPGHAFISRSTAGKYFRDADPVGRTFTVDGRTDYTVAGVFEDRPQNTHLKFDILLSFPNVVALRGREVMEAWGHTGFFTYLRLRSGSDPAAFEKKMADLVEAQCGDMMKEYRLVVELKMQPLADIHLTSHFMQEYETNGSRRGVDFLSVVALFIIVMAWVNAVNLSTARSLTRAREVGLRKTVGATRLQLVFQFYFETLLVNVLSVLLALPLIQSALPLVRRLTGTPAEAGLWSEPWFWRTLVGLFLAGVAFSGLYPAAAMSATRPAVILRGRIDAPARGVGVRKILVVFQFAIALALLTGTVTVFRQISYLKNTGLGFDKERVLVVNTPRVLEDGSRERIRTFKQEVLRNPGILKACVVTEVPGRQIYWDAGGIYRGGDHAGKGKNYLIVGADEDFIDVFGLKILRGRNFSEEFPSDDKALILNETAVAWMGFENGEKAVGEPVDYWGEIYTVVGVLADFHQQSPKAAFEPHLYRLMPYARPEIGRFALKLGPGGPADAVRSVKETFERLFPGNPFEYFFLDDYFNEQYSAEERMGRVIGSFSLLALFVTGLGIFGISSFLALQRRREIGVRKVLGATTGGILRLLSGEFAVLIGIAALLSGPPVYWGIQKWLGSFASRMDVDVWLFFVPLFVVLAAAGLSIGTNVIQAALADPVDAIKHE